MDKYIQANFHSIQYADDTFFLSCDKDIDWWLKLIKSAISNLFKTSI